MTQSGPPAEAPRNENLRRRRDRAVGILAMESIALGTALAMPITPSKTGSTWSPAHFFSPDPTYLEQVAAFFVLGNALLVGLGLVAWLVSKRTGHR
jgi:hypothetical protein